MNLWYQTLTKPPLTPPSSYFPIAWGILYTLIGIAFLIVLFKPISKNRYYALNFFTIQIIFNFLWSYIFFELQSVNYALVDIILLFGFLTGTIIYFFKVSKTAGILLLPYMFQVIFAIYLNAGIVILN